jgi:hypothetical protein
VGIDNGGLTGGSGGLLLSSAFMVGVLVCVEDVVPLLVLGRELGLECGRLVRERRERVEPTSESDSSPLSTWDFHLETRRSEERADSS